MATPGELLRSMEVALERGREAQDAAVRAMAESVANVKATGVSVSSRRTADGVQVRLTERPNARAQVRLSPADVAGKVSDRASRVGVEAMQRAVGRS